MTIFEIVLLAVAVIFAVAWMISLRSTMSKLDALHKFTGILTPICMLIMTYYFQVTSQRLQSDSQEIVRQNSVVDEKRRKSEMRPEIDIGEIMILADSTSYRVTLTNTGRGIARMLRVFTQNDGGFNPIIQNQFYSGRQIDSIGLEKAITKALHTFKVPYGFVIEPRSARGRDWLPPGESFIMEVWYATSLAGKSDSVVVEGKLNGKEPIVLYLSYLDLDNREYTKVIRTAPDLVSTLVGFRPDYYKQFFDSLTRLSNGMTDPSVRKFENAGLRNEDGSLKLKLSD